MVICGFTATFLVIYNTSLDSDSLILGFLVMPLIIAMAVSYFLISLVKTFNRLEGERGIFKSHRIKEMAYSILFTLVFGSCLFFPGIAMISHLTKSNYKWEGYWQFKDLSCWDKNDKNIQPIGFFHNRVEILNPPEQVCRIKKITDVPLENNTLGFDEKDGIDWLYFENEIGCGFLPNPTRIKAISDKEIAYGWPGLAFKSSKCEAKPE